MILDVVTLYAVNVLCSAIFACATLLAVYVDPAHAYWRSWTLCFTFGVLSLLVSTIGLAYGQNSIVQIGNILLIPTFYYYYEGMRKLADQDVPPSLLYGGGMVFCAISVHALQTGNNLYIDVSKQVLVLAACLAAAFHLLLPHFKGLTSRYGLVLSALIHCVAASVHLLFLLGISPFAWAPYTFVLSVHLLAGIVFTVLNGSFLFALTHERTALENREKALRDPLTGAFNRRAFDQYLTLLLATDEPAPFALLHLDLDHFKSVNDRFGHPAGDQVLIEVVEKLKETLAEPRFIARLGGEEFAALLTEISMSQAHESAEHVRDTLENMTFVFETGQQTQITTSIGLYFGDGDGLSKHELMTEVDQCLYRAKKAGRNRIVTATVQAAA